MYGSQYHSQQALTTIRPFTEELQRKHYSLPTKKSKQTNFLTLIVLILITAFVSNAAFAGSSSPQLKGGNGNANGR